MDKRILTASQMKLGCWRRWYYEYELGLDPGGPSSAMITGIDFHNLRAGLEAVDERAQAMYKAWAEVNNSLEPHYELVESEKVVLVDAGEFYLAGRIDGIVRLETGERAILEIKTSSRMPSGNYFIGKEFDAQLLMYCLMTGLRKVVLDFARAPQIKKERYEDYSDECYRRMVEKPKSYFVRALIEFDEEEMERFKHDLVVWYRMLQMQLEYGWFLRESAVCQSWSACPFWMLCKGESDEGLWPRKEKRFPELEPELGELLSGG